MIKTRTAVCRFFLLLFGVGCLVGAVALVPERAVAETLISIDEAALPPQKGAVPNLGRGVTRGPKVLLLDLESEQKSPLRFQIKFQTFAGARVDFNSLKISYLKEPVVDLTQRVRPFTYAAGIDMANAQAPPGDHLIRVDIKDSEGRTASRSFLLRVTPER